jgi:hypothetical protein
MILSIVVGTFIANWQIGNHPLKTGLIKSVAFGGTLFLYGIFVNYQKQTLTLQEIYKLVLLALATIYLSIVFLVVIIEQWKLANRPYLTLITRVLSLGTSLTIILIINKYFTNELTKEVFNNLCLLGFFITILLALFLISIKIYYDWYKLK